MSAKLKCLENFGVFKRNSNVVLGYYEKVSDADLTNYNLFNSERTRKRDINFDV